MAYNNPVYDTIKLQFEPKRNGYYCFAVWIYEKNRCFLWDRYVDQEEAEKTAISVQRNVYPYFTIEKSQSYINAIAALNPH